MANSYHLYSGTSVQHWQPKSTIFFIVLVSKGQQALQRMIQNVKARLYLLRWPWSHRLKQADTCPQWPVVHTNNRETWSALQKEVLPTWEGKKKPTKKHSTETPVCSHSLALQCLCPAPQETGERRGDRKRVQNQREKRDWIPHILQKCPTTSTSTGEVQVQKMDLVPSTTLQPLPTLHAPTPDCLEMNVVTSYHLETFTPRIKPPACSPIGVSTSKSYYCGYQSPSKWPQHTKSWALNEVFKKKKALAL